jgi:hypothetical protein
MSCLCIGLNGWLDEEELEALEGSDLEKGIV